MNAPFATSAIADRLRRETEGEVLFSAADRGRYATDASIYQVMPVGVLVPKRIEDVAAAMAICREAGIAVLPRGGGTSLEGHTMVRGGRGALVLDLAHMDGVLAVRPGAAPALMMAKIGA
jgi:FAD/FMN-containing dehydrogenase